MRGGEWSLKFLQNLTRILESQILKGTSRNLEFCIIPRSRTLCEFKLNYSLGLIFLTCVSPSRKNHLTPLRWPPGPIAFMHLILIKMVEKRLIMIMKLTTTYKHLFDVKKSIKCLWLFNCCLRDGRMDFRGSHCRLKLLKDPIR